MSRRPNLDYEAGMLSTRKASEFLDIPQGTLAYWRSTRQGPPYIKMGLRNVRYPKAGLIAYAEAGLRLPTRAA